MEMRLNKYLREIGTGSRRKCDEYIKKGFIKINGKIVSKLGIKINTEIDVVEISNDIQFEKEKYKYILFHKPKGSVCTKSENEGENIFSYFTSYKEIDINSLNYAGRLDKESRGLIILSTDGEFIYKVAGSEFEKTKEYIVTVNKKLTDFFLEKLRIGVFLGGKKTKPAVVDKLDDYKYKIIIKEGMNRQIRKMARQFDYKVIDLLRVKISQISDENLKSGEFRYLTKEEINSMKK